jgi:hypothetical protein
LEAEYGEHGERLQAEAVSTFLLVADAGAWETDCLRLLYLDGKGNVVHHSAVGGVENVQLLDGAEVLRVHLVAA